MTDTFWIIAEIIVGIALLGLFTAVVTAVMVPLLNKQRPGAATILGERYARGELTREQYQQMLRDIGIGGSDAANASAPTPDGRGLMTPTNPR